ncbi:hypothetical protein G4O51_07260 [Candidatus Bathyarchaeota archaeon A05DMB-2]|nr:hypothetical protein [Candidatus Bathyarchaeota archaeon A05DMB-2]
MERTSSSEKHSSAKINKIYFLLPIFLAILISLIYSQSVLLAQPYSEGSTFIFEGYSAVFIALNIFAITIVSAISLFIFLRILKKRREVALRILVAAFIIGGMLSTLLFGKHLFILLNLESPLFLLVVAFVAYVGTYFAYLAFVEALSDRARNMLFVVCSGTLGAFLGVLLPTLAVVGIALFLSGADLILIHRSTVEKIVGEAEYERLIMKLSFSNKGWAIGIGDLTCYSMVVSSSSLSYGVFVGGLSLLLILVGSFLSLALAVRLVRVPGLPIAVMLGVLPSLVMLLFF